MLRSEDSSWDRRLYVKKKTIIMWDRSATQNDDIFGGPAFKVVDSKTLALPPAIIVHDRTMVRPWKQVRNKIHPQDSATFSARFSLRVE